MEAGGEVRRVSQNYFPKYFQFLELLDGAKVQKRQGPIHILPQQKSQHSKPKTIVRTKIKVIIDIVVVGFYVVDANIPLIFKKILRKTIAHGR